MTKEEQNMIDEIMDCFEFRDVHKAMIALNWKWGDESPEEHEIRVCARDMLTRLVCKNSYCVATGGLYAYRFNDDYGNIESLELKFVLTEWSSGND